ncbi:MAG: HisA/HisF-related TIM barrel protein [Gemmatimonadales bacterium]
MFGGPRDPAEAAAAYAEADADEIVFVARATPLELLCGLAERVAPALTIPITFWADLTAATEVGDLLAAGAARVAIQRAALDDPDLIAKLAREFGSEAIAVAVTAAGAAESWRVYDAPGGAAREWDALTWARVIEAQNGGAIVIESSSGGRHGEPYDLELLRSVSSVVARPALAAGEAGKVEDVFDALMIGDVDGVLVGPLLHSGEATVKEIKSFLSERGLPVRG